MSDAWTVRSLLAWARDWLQKKGIDTARLDSELLLARALNCDRVRLYIDVDKPLQPDELARFKPLVQRRGNREPVAYILGTKEFYGRPFAVGQGVFIPRPETELLVQLAIAGKPKTALDLCTGSGAIGITIAHELPDAHVDLVELSPEAVKFARENAAKIDRVQLFEGDLFTALPHPKRYEAIVSNPPYIPAGEPLQPEILQHEPHLALYAGDDGLDTIRRIVAQSRDWLTPGGFFGMEIDPPQAQRVVGMLQQAGFEKTKVHKDLAGLDRHVTGVA
jgi:release factor glutamine methyltransferase